jgi:nicotinamidase-related amidase
VTTLKNRPRVALVVVDVQVAVVEGAYQRDAVVSRVAACVEHARNTGIPVIWIQHHDANLLEGSDAWAIVPELLPAAGEPIVAKSYSDSFEATTLESELAERSVGEVIVVGAQSDQCIRGTLHGALVRGYHVTLVGDAHTTEDNTAWGAPPPEQVIAHTNLYWSGEGAPGRVARVMTSAEFAGSLTPAP